uniref:BSD domain-containing protein n=1 Tax=Phaeocystis antarctica TaxID=33657 RepID=A0A7S0EHP2_9EUKA
MGSGQSQEAAVWPMGWSEIPAEQRLVARQAILQISTVPREDFLSIETERYCISHDDWSFEAYHGAAAAAVQEDKGLNRMIYCIVPRKQTESDFWRLYFSKVNYIIDSVKVHGVYPPPAPQPPPLPASARAASVVAPSAADESSCLLQ